MIEPRVFVPVRPFQATLSGDGSFSQTWTAPGGVVITGILANVIGVPGSGIAVTIAATPVINHLISTGAVDANFDLTGQHVIFQGDTIELAAVGGTTSSGLMVSGWAFMSP